MKQKFNGEILTTTKTVNNILRIFDKANGEGLNWYEEANRYAWDLRMKFDIDRLKVAGIIAAFSPLKSWETNKTITEQFLRTGKASHTRVMTQKAKDILASDGSLEVISDILNGNKITNFFLNIAEPTAFNNVTIDRHAISIAVGEVLPDAKMRMSVKQYQFFLKAYQVAAYKRDILPSQMQSVTWVKWRIMKKNNEL